MTYGPRKICYVPHAENFHQVWSWYDHPLPSYSVLASYILRYLVTVTLDLLTLVSFHTWRLKCSTSSLSLKLLRLSVLEFWCMKLVHWIWPWPRRLEVTHRSPGLSSVDRPYTSFYRHSVVCSNFCGCRQLRFRDVAGFVSKMPLLHITLVFRPKFRDLPLELDWWPV